MCLLNSYANPVHEREIGALLDRYFPAIPHTLSTDVVPEIGEYERTSTTVINASLLPLVRSYLGSLRTKLADIGVTGRLLVMQSHGGIAGDRAAAMRPAYIVESGPAAGAIAAAAGRYTPCSSHTRWAVRSRCGASLLPLGLAVETTGTAAWIAQETLRLLGDVPLWVLQGALAILTTGFTLLMSNVGATVLLVPLAINIALGAGGNPVVFALTVALAASNSLLIPTHQVNALIMGPGGYRVVDFMRAGGVMTILFLVILIPMVNLIF